MRESWETYIDVGIVLPKLFSGVADDKNRFFEGLMTILTDPFFTTVEVSYTPDPEIVEMTGEYARLVSAARQQGEHRLCLVIQTICTTGIRVSELKFITVEAVELGRAEVSNKGKRRTVFLPHNLQRLLQAYLQAKKSPPERCLSPGAESRWTGQMYGGI